jgi:hypothetical protein
MHAFAVKWRQDDSAACEVAILVEREERVTTDHSPERIGGAEVNRLGVGGEHLLDELRRADQHDVFERRMARRDPFTPQGGNRNREHAAMEPVQTSQRRDVAACADPHPRRQILQWPGERQTRRQAVHAHATVASGCEEMSSRAR